HIPLCKKSPSIPPRRTAPPDSGGRAPPGRHKAQRFRSIRPRHCSFGLPVSSTIPRAPATRFSQSVTRIAYGLRPGRAGGEKMKFDLALISPPIRTILSHYLKTARLILLAVLVTTMLGSLASIAAPYLFSRLID